MKKVFALFVMLSLVFVFTVQAASMVWDDPGLEEWGIIDGYVVYFTCCDGTETYNKMLSKAELVRADNKVTYSNIEDNLNLHHSIVYSFYIKAYNDSGESGPSNTVTYTREGFVPPTNRLPDPVASSPLSPSLLEI